MTTASPGLRALMVYALILPLALMLGYMLATPTDLSSLGTIALVLSVISLPLILKWHYEFMLLSWNMVAIVFFLPGEPEVWLTASLISFIIAVMQRALTKDMRFISVPSITWPLIFFLVVILATAYLTGGIGVRALGSATFGGRGYIWMVGAGMGFWAMTARAIPASKAPLCIALFFLGGFTSIITTIIAFGPPQLYNLALVFPISAGEFQKVANELRFTVGFISDQIERFSGLTFACLALFCFLLARFGLQEMLSGRRFWRFLLLVAIVLAGTLGGFRSILILQLLTLPLVFYFEGLLRSKYLGILVLVLILVGALVVPLANRLPLSVQRALSILPLNVDPVARFEAEASTEWRVQMWQMVLPEVPRYIWLGKGLAVSGAELELSGDLANRGLTSTQEGAILSRNFHNGPLSLIIPFGIWGVLGWIWLSAASIRALYLNYCYGEQSLRKINTFLLAFFIAKTILFLGVYGDLRDQFASFLGLVGLSVALNGGIRRRPVSVVTAQDLASPTHRQFTSAAPAAAQ